MAKVLRRGPKEPCKYRGECPRCGSYVEFTAAEVREHLMAPNTKRTCGNCPVCDTLVVVEQFPPPMPPGRGG